jgi:hypothetical protein
VRQRIDVSCVGVDDDLVVGRAPVVFGLLGDRVVTGGDQRAVHDQHAVLTEPLARLQGKYGATRSMMRSTADFEIPKSGASCRSVRFVRQ